MDNKVTVRVTVSEDYGKQYAYGKEIEPRNIRCFEPIDVCNDRIYASMFGGVTLDEARIITKRRKAFADDLAAEISDAIMSYIERNDKENGYTKEATK